MIPQSVMAGIVSRVREDAIAQMRKNDQVATGRTIARIRIEASDDRGAVVGPEHLGALEYGVRPSGKYANPGPAYVASIRDWMAARQLTGNPYAVAKSILRRGTRLFRGDDPRFPGGAPSGTFTKLLTPAYLGALRVQLQVGAVPAIRSEVLNALKF